MGKATKLVGSIHAEVRLIGIPKVGFAVGRTLRLRYDREVYHNGLGRCLGKQSIHSTHIEGNDGIIIVHTDIGIIQRNIEVIVTRMLGEKQMLLSAPATEIGIHVAIPHRRLIIRL